MKDAKRKAAASTTAPPISDEAVKKATGRDWAEWCRLLDAESAHTMKHAEIARMVHDKFQGGNWWSQMQTHRCEGGREDEEVLGRAA